MRAAGAWLSSAHLVPSDLTFKTSLVEPELPFLIYFLRAVVIFTYVDVTWVWDEQVEVLSGSSHEIQGEEISDFYKFLISKA